MPNFQLGDSEQAPYTLVELDAASQPVQGISTDVITIVSSAPTSISVVPDTIPAAGSVASGFVVGGVPATSVQITATVTHADGTSLTTTDLLDCVGGNANSLSFGLGAPVAQTGGAAGSSARRK